MIEQNQLKPLRKVAIADHLWSCFEQMAQEMGTDRDGLVNQALFMFARLNGFLVPGGAAGASASPPAPALAAVKPAMRPAPVAPPPSEPEPDFDEAAREAEAEADQASGQDDGQQEAEGYEEPEPPPPPPPPAPRPPPRAPPSPPVISGGRGSRSSGEASAEREEGGAPPRLFENAGGPPPKPLDEDPVRRAVAKQVLETAAELEKLIKGKNEPARPPPPSAALSDSTNSGANPDEKLLYLSGDDGEMLKVGKERFLIGRGKHCDLVINSGKVSREHAAVVRDGAEFFIEDLGSSNGTWFNKQRIKRRKVEEGDEYFICSEKIRCTFR
jgi:hypothetical protein